MDVNPRQIFLNSDHASFQFKLPNGLPDSSSVLFDFQEPIIAPNNYQMSIGVISFMMPASWNRVNENNNKIYLTSSLGASNQLIEIPIGSYNVSTLRTKLNELFNPYSITITYDIPTNQYIFSITATNDFSFLSSSTALRLLGFTIKTAHTSTGTTLQSNSVVDLSGISQLYISTSLQTHNYDSRTKKLSNILCVIPVNQQSNGILQYTNHVPNRNIINPTVISRLHVFVSDEDGHLVDLRQARWSAVLVINFVQNVLNVVPNKIETQDIKPNNVGN